MPAAAQRTSPNPDRGLGLCFLLGNDYERKKKKLQQELQLDYKHYAAMKKDLKTEPRPQHQGLSLPIHEKISVQEKLREERRNEYNLFLQEKAQIGRLKRGTPRVTSKPGQVQASDAVYNISSAASPLPLLNTRTNTHPPPRERPASRRDAATLTEAVENGNRTGTRGPGTRGPGTRGRRRWQLQRPKEHLYMYSSEEELVIEQEDEFRQRRRADSLSPEYKEERRSRKHRASRAPLNIKEVEAPAVQDHNNNENLWKSDLQTPESMRTAAASRPATSKDKAHFATGLLIGAADEQTASQTRKEKYKQELLQQIAEQQRNKIREKKLRLAATGATDPEKQPDRIKPLGAENRQYDSWRRGVPYQPGTKSREDKEDAEQRGTFHVDHSAALSQLTGRTGVPSLDYFNEDYHRDFSHILGEVANPRVGGVPPPVPPSVTNNHKTPYDALYHYYGAGDPLGPHPPYNQNDLAGGMQQAEHFHSPPQRPTSLRPSRRTQSVATDQHHSPLLDVEGLSADKSRLMRERALSHQEALRQQIKEREQHKRREKEEKERYDAKIEAEMMAFNPWGRSGGGAPIKDQKGNLVSDLNQMHRTNEDSYRNPVSRNSGQTQSFLTRKGDSPGGEARTPLPHRVSGFNDLPTPQQLHMQDKYKEDLKQQIEENRRKQTEATERMRIEEEKEERRLAEQRARIQREYEEEQSRQQKKEHRLENKARIQEPQTHQEVKRERQEQEKKVPESDREEKKAQWSYEILQREPSPPIPTLQRKLINAEASRPSTVEGQLTSRTERSVSAPQYRPVPAQIPQLQDGQQEVMRELSALRRYLRNEQRQLEAQLGQREQQEPHNTPPNRLRGRPRVDAFESTNKPSTRSPSSGAARVNMQNIREFNQLKYRDTSSREEVRHLYPDPPTDAQSLDIQQQALLREQQRKLRLMKREPEPDLSEHQQSHHRSRNKAGRLLHRDSTLPSETDFIDVYSGDACEEPSAECRQRSAVRRRRDEAVDQRGRNIRTDVQSLYSETSLNPDSKVRTNIQHRVRRLDTGDHTGTSERRAADEDLSSLHSALERRVSVDTVATEAWLRPGT